MINYSLIKYLLGNGYTNKQIAIIMDKSLKAIQSASRTRAYEKAAPSTRQMTQEEKTTKAVMDVFLSCPPLPCAANATYLMPIEYDYLVILDFLGVERSQKQLACPLASGAQMKQSELQMRIPLKQFDHRQLGISDADYKEFMVRCYCYIGKPELWG